MIEFLFSRNLSFELWKGGMSQPPLPAAAPPYTAPPASFATELDGAEQCSWLAQLSAKTVYELRAKSLTQGNEMLDAEAMCHKAFTYELFAQMTRDGSKVNPGSPLGQPWVPDFFRASVCPRRKLGYGRSRKLFGKTWIPVQTEPASTGPRTKLVNRGSPRPVFVFACAGQPDQIVNL